MSFRNLSPQQMFIDWAREHRPTHAFPGTGKRSFDDWQQETLPLVLQTLGDRPQRVPPDPELLAEWEHDGLLKQKWLINVGRHISATFQINRPDKLRTAGPAILCCHGHGPFGKEPVMGNDTSPALRASIEAHRYDYGHRMAKAGVTTFAIDWIGFGERNDNQKPNNLNTNGQRDWCNLYYLHATMLGTTSLAINVAHGMAAVDFACTFDAVDPERVGVMGLSGGGTMALWMGLCDERLKATEIICYSDLWAHFGIRDINYCGMQVAPGLFKLVDLPDLQGLLAPSPLLVDIGANDDCFKVDTAMACFRRVTEIYDAASAKDKLELDLHPGPHAWGGHKSDAFFKANL